MVPRRCSTCMAHNYNGSGAGPARDHPPVTPGAWPRAEPTRAPFGWLHSPAMRTLRLLVVVVLATWRLGAAQQASAYLPIHHWATPYLEHFIARGVMADPTPLTRPWREGDVLKALAELDTTQLSGSERAVVRRITTELTGSVERGTGNGGAVRVGGSGGAAQASHARRDPPRAPGVGPTTASGSL